MQVGGATAAQKAAALAAGKQKAAARGAQPAAYKASIQAAQAAEKKRIAQQKTVKPITLKARKSVDAAQQDLVRYQSAPNPALKSKLAGSAPKQAADALAAVKAAQAEVTAADQVVASYKAALRAVPKNGLASNKLIQAQNQLKMAKSNLTAAVAIKKSADTLVTKAKQVIAAPIAAPAAGTIQQKAAAANAEAKKLEAQVKLNPNNVTLKKRATNARKKAVGLKQSANANTKKKAGAPVKKKGSTYQVGRWPVGGVPAGKQYPAGRFLDGKSYPAGLYYKNPATVSTAAAYQAGAPMVTAPSTPAVVKGPTGKPPAPIATPRPATPSSTPVSGSMQAQVNAANAAAKKLEAQVKQNPNNAALKQRAKTARSKYVELKKKANANARAKGGPIKKSGATYKAGKWPTNGVPPGRSYPAGKYRDGKPYPAGTYYTDPSKVASAAEYQKKAPMVSVPSTPATGKGTGAVGTTATTGVKKQYPAGKFKDGTKYVAGKYLADPSKFASQKAYQAAVSKGPKGPTVSASKGKKYPGGKFKDGTPYPPGDYAVNPASYQNPTAFQTAMGGLGTGVATGLTAGLFQRYPGGYYQDGTSYPAGLYATDPSLYTSKADYQMAVTSGTISGMDTGMGMDYTGMGTDYTGMGVGISQAQGAAQQMPAAMFPVAGQQVFQIMNLSASGISRLKSIVQSTLGVPAQQVSVYNVSGMQLGGGDQLGGAGQNVFVSVPSGYATVGGVAALKRQLTSLGGKFVQKPTGLPSVVRQKITTKAGAMGSQMQQGIYTGSQMQQGSYTGSQMQQGSYTGSQGIYTGSQGSYTGSMGSTTSNKNINPATLPPGQVVSIRQQDVIGDILPGDAYDPYEVASRPPNEFCADFGNTQGYFRVCGTKAQIQSAIKQRRSSSSGMMGDVGSKIDTIQQLTQEVEDSVRRSGVIVGGSRKRYRKGDKPGKTRRR